MSEPVTRTVSLVEEAAWDANHDCRPPLPVIAIRTQTVTAAQRDEQMPRPLIGHRELQFDGRVAVLKFREFRAHARERGLGSKPLACRARSREQDFDFAKLLTQLRLRRHGLPSSAPILPRQRHQPVKTGSIRSFSPRTRIFILRSSRDRGPAIRSPPCAGERRNLGILRPNRADISAP